MSLSNEFTCQTFMIMTMIFTPKRIWFKFIFISLVPYSMPIDRFNHLTKKKQSSTNWSIFHLIFMIANKKMACKKSNKYLLFYLDKINIKKSFIVGEEYVDFRSKLIRLFDEFENAFRWSYYFHNFSDWNSLEMEKIDLYFCTDTHIVNDVFMFTFTLTISSHL